VGVRECLNEAVGARAIVSCQLSLPMGEYSVPEPDFAVLAARDDFYRAAFPRVSDTFLVIEVSDTSLRFDCMVKMSLYARHGIAEYWIVDLESSQLHVFRHPEGESYREVLTLASPGVIEIPGLPGATIDLANVLRQG
jgi:Uma2 family endonuclease